MRYISDDEYKAQLKEIKENNKSIKRMQLLNDEKNKMKKKFRMPSTSKLVLWAVILFSLEIVFFIEYCMVKYADFSATYALIGIPATIIPTILGYFYKSKAENTQGGIVYESAMMTENINDEEDDDDAVG